MSKKLFLLPALLLALAIGALTTSCNKDCKTDQDDFTGQFVATEDCSSSQPATYTVTVVGGASDSEVLITNFWGTFQNSVRASIDCDNITIDRQEPDGDDFFVEGSGSRTKDGDRVTISLSYTVTDETGGVVVGTDNCSSTTYTKL